MRMPPNPFLAGSPAAASENGHYVTCALAPLLVEEIFQIIQRLNQEEKLTVLLVEQNAAMALTVAQYGYIMENGRIVLDGETASLRDNADVKEFYLGLTEVGQRKSYRDIKHYRRRKRWLS